MHLDCLKYFQDVVQEKSISKAAKKSHISQSALSQLIQKLEEDLGYKLLNRSNKGVEVTAMGEIVLKHSINIINNYHKMLMELEALDKKKNKIYVNGTWSLVAYSLPCVIYRLKKKYPQYDYELVASNYDKTVLDIQNDICDFGFVDAEPDSSLGMFSYKMGKEKVVLIAPANYNVPDKIILGDLLKYEVIMCTISTCTCNMLNQKLKKIDKSINDLNVIFNVDSVSAVKSSVTNGYGMAFVPYDAVKHELYEKKVKLIEIEDINLDYDIYLISKKGNNLSKAVKESIDYLIEIGRKSFC